MGIPKYEKAKCPFHYEDKPHLTFGPDNSIYCERCGMHVNIIVFLMLYLKKSFYQVLRMLAKEAEIKIPDNIKKEMKAYRLNIDIDSV